MAQNVAGSVYAFGPDYQGGYDQLRGFTDAYTKAGGKLANDGGNGNGIAGAGSADAAPNGAPAPARPRGVGDIESREDVLRAIDAICAYYARHEPSSPVPLLLDRAKRLISKSFLEVLEDIAPESLVQVRQLGVIKGDETK